MKLSKKGKLIHLNGHNIMIDIKKIYEDAVAAGAVGGSVGGGEGITGIPSPGDSSAISDTDVLGNCDHEHGEGYMHDGCFHLPSKVLKTLRRFNLAPKKKSKKKKAKKKTT